MHVSCYCRSSSGGNHNHTPNCMGLHVGPWRATPTTTATNTYVFRFYQLRAGLALDLIWYHGLQKPGCCLPKRKLETGEQ